MSQNKRTVKLLQRAISFLEIEQLKQGFSIFNSKIERDE
jgi:hypothetical protein